MNTKIDKWLDDHRNQIIKDLQGCIHIRSIKSTPKPGAPFGEDIRKCLEYTLDIAKKLGFSAKNMDGYLGCVDYGEGKECLGILTHLDVVPEGGGWNYDPYGGEVAGNRIYGRGVLDDKGPTISALYALKAIDDCGIPLSRRVRIILGCDEENDWGCMKHYQENEPSPDLSFTPDGEYPLVNSEKGIFHGTYECKFASAITIEAGEAANVVPGEAVAVIPLDVAIVKPIAERYAQKSGFGVTVTALDEGTEIKTIGKPSHAAKPQDGRNALQAMLILLAAMPLQGMDAKIIGILAENFKMEYNGQSIGMNRADDSGDLTLNMGVIHWNHTGFQLRFDLRCPISMKEEEIKSGLSAAMKDTGAVLTDVSFKKGFFLPENSEIVSKLLAVFRTRTGKDLPPHKIGGGTYARALPNAVSFGPEWDGGEISGHMANEFMTIDELMFNTKITADAILALAGDR